MEKESGSQALSVPRQEFAIPDFGSHHHIPRLDSMALSGPTLPSTALAESHPDSILTRS